MKDKGGRGFIPGNRSFIEAQPTIEEEVIIMPYADPEKRRLFQREYKRKWREKQKKISQFRGFKVYVCPKFPNFRVARAHFDNGFLITNDPEVQVQVEAHREFGRRIFALAMELHFTPNE